MSANERGRLVLAFQIAIGVGIVIATVVGASESIVWRWSIGIAAVPAAIMLALLLRLPESPRWLVRGGDRDGAAAVLRRVRPSGFDVDGELDEMADLARKEQKASTRGWSGLRERWVRPALVLGCGIAIFTQLSGIEMIVYYSPTILTDAGFAADVALEVSVALGLSYLLAQLGGLAIIDRVGRRRLTLIMIPGAAVALFVLGLLFVTGHAGRDQPAHHADPAQPDQRRRGGPRDVAVRRVQRRGVAVRVLPHARPDRRQPRGDRAEAGRRPVQARRVHPYRGRSVTALRTTGRAPLPSTG